MACSQVFKDAPLETTRRQTPEADEMTVEEKRRNVRMMLGVLKNEINSEKLPPSIDGLLNAYGRLGQQGRVIVPEPITDNIVKLQGIVNDKLVKLQDRSILGQFKEFVPHGFLSFVGNSWQKTRQASQGLQSSSQPTRNAAWQQHAVVREELAANIVGSSLVGSQSRYEQESGAASIAESNSSAIIQQPSWLQPYELENGERVSEVVRLSRSVHSTLTTEVVRFREVATAADHLDRVCHSAFGFSFYSDDFGSFCSLMADAAQNASPELEAFLLRMEDSRKREFMRKMSSDPGLRNQFKHLKESVLDKNHLFKIIALVFVNEILSAVPVNYKSNSTELVLESLQCACNIFLQTQLSEDLSSDKVIRGGIEKLMSKLYLMKMCTTPSS